MCIACGSQNEAAARFCHSCGVALRVATPVGDTRKIVTVVFTDIEDSTVFGDALDPESVRQMMARYFAEMRSVLERHGGTVEKFIGDAVMAVFGIPTAHEDDALRAVRAAVEMRAVLGGLNAEFERCGASRSAPGRA